MSRNLLITMIVGAALAAAPAYAAAPQGPLKVLIKADSDKGGGDQKGSKGKDVADTGCNYHSDLLRRLCDVSDDHGVGNGNANGNGNGHGNGHDHGPPPGHCFSNGRGHEIGRGHGHDNDDDCPVSS